MTNDHWHDKVLRNVSDPIFYDKFWREKLTVKIPSFKIENRYDVRNLLERAGINHIFEDGTIRKKEMRENAYNKISYFTQDIRVDLEETGNNPFLYQQNRDQYNNNMHNSYYNDRQHKNYNDRNYDNNFNRDIYNNRSAQYNNPNSRRNLDVEYDVFLCDKPFCFYVVDNYGMILLNGVINNLDRCNYIEHEPRIQRIHKMESVYNQTTKLINQLQDTVISQLKYKQGNYMISPLS